MEPEGMESQDGPEIVDVNHYDSHVFVRFEDGRSVVLTGDDVLRAADARQPEPGAGADAAQMSGSSLAVSQSRNMQSP